MFKLLPSLDRKGVLSDPNYTMIEYKDAKTGNMKKKLKFTRPKVIVLTN